MRPMIGGDFDGQTLAFFLGMAPIGVIRDDPALRPVHRHHRQRQARVRYRPLKGRRRNLQSARAVDGENDSLAPRGSTCTRRIAPSRAHAQDWEENQCSKNQPRFASSNFGGHDDDLPGVANHKVIVDQYRKVT